MILLLGNRADMKRRSSAILDPTVHGSATPPRAIIPMRTLCTVELLRLERRRWALSTTRSPPGSTNGHGRWLCG